VAEWISQHFDRGLHGWDDGRAGLPRFAACSHHCRAQRRSLEQGVDAALGLRGRIGTGKSLQILVERLDDLEHELRDAIGLAAPVEHVDAFLQAAKLLGQPVALVVEESLSDVEEEHAAGTEGVADA